MPLAPLCRMMCLAALAVVASALPAGSQEPPTAEEDATIAKLHARTVQFLEGVSLGRVESALAELVSGGSLAKQDEAIRKLTEQTRELESKYGKYRAFERIDARRIGEDLVLAKYLYKCENYPVVWYFTYYRDFKRSDAAPESDNWILIALRFDTDLELLGF